ncbi:MAG: glycerol kinase GlpK [Alphaproteobacteria bacterium]|nr:glycerol kinase GlpK [Alphaproteobacteria bacterium]
MTHYLLAIDQGTTSTRAMVFDDQGEVMATARQEFTQYFPADGWVEHDGMEIIQTVMTTVKEALDQLPAGCFPTAIGITNQRETTVIWDREPIYPAIVWQDRRTADICRNMKQDGVEPMISEKTGLLFDPYFSATKINWILDNVPDARRRAVRGELAFGTVDSFILWHLTGGKVHKTDVTNAARTLLFNIQTMMWDPDLLKLFDVPAALLPTVHDCDHHFGDVSLFGQALPITAIAGDQQAALFGQNCLEAGQIKCTLGTGGFVMMNTGDSIIRSQNRLLTTVACALQGRVTYALEGSFFCAGSAVQWLRDGLKIIGDAGETEALARSIDSSHGVVMVPAFTGLGAPHWQAEARGTLFGLTRATGRAEIARATLESVGLQAADLVAAMQHDSGIAVERLKLDGGMAANEWLLQFFADIMQVEIVRSGIMETTAFGVAMLAALGAGVHKKVNKLSTVNCYTKVKKPEMTIKDTFLLREIWKKAVESTCYFSTR